MKKEEDFVTDIIDQFEYDEEIAQNILKGGNPSDANILFYSRQKDWCLKHIISLKTRKRELMKETLSERVIRSLCNEKDLEKINEVIKNIVNYSSTLLIDRENKLIEKEKEFIVRVKQMEEHLQREKYELDEKQKSLAKAEKK